MHYRLYANCFGNLRFNESTFDYFLVVLTIVERHIHHTYKMSFGVTNPLYFPDYMEKEVNFHFIQATANLSEY